MRRIAILGGTFNPIHIGHIRPAVEVYEALRPDYVDLLPCASPPHKSNTGLLPFALRAAMVEAAARPFSFLRVNHMENSRSGPSYTHDTLREYQRQYPQCSLSFVLGAGDFAMLPTWHNGVALTDMADMVVLPRSGEDERAFHATTQALWSGAVPETVPAPFAAAYRLPSGHAVWFLPQPRLDISATLIRERWLAGRDITYLVPQEVCQLLEAHADAVRECWTAIPPGTKTTD